MRGGVPAHPGMESSVTTCRSPPKSPMLEHPGNAESARTIKEKNFVSVRQRLRDIDAAAQRRRTRRRPPLSAGGGE